MESSKETASDKSAQPIRFAGSVLGSNRHICGFFRNSDEEYGLLLPFIKEGLERGEKAFHVVSPHQRREHLWRLTCAGIDVTDARAARQFELCKWEEVYFCKGYFDQNRMLAIYQHVFDASTELGYGLTPPGCAHGMAFEDREGVRDLLEYEARFNLMHQGFRR